ncbi:MAG: ABC transporter permease [Pyrinomonadaceae bacterium]|nr:ABC transporter permease [Phycisphaerales bacterium]
MLAIALNDLRLLFRDKAAAFFTFVFPLFFAIFFSFVFKGSGGGGKMAVAVFDEDGTDASARLVTDLKADAALKTSIVESRKAGTELVRRSKATALVVVPKGFAAGAEGMFTGGKMPLEAVVDPSRAAEAGLLTGKLNELAFRQMSGMFTDNRRMKSMLDKSREEVRTFAPDGSPRSEAFLKFFDGADGLSAQLEQIQKEADAPDAKPDAENADSEGARARTPGFNPVDVKITQLQADEPGAEGGAKKEFPRRSTDFSFPQGIAWGLMGCVIGFASSLASERRRGTLIRLTTAPITRAHILGGKALACFIVCLSVQVMLIAVAIAMGSQVWSWPTLIAAILSASIGFVGIAMLLAALAGSEEGAGGMARAVPMILAMIGGGTIPLFIMPPFVKTLSNISPFKWAIYSVEGGMWRGLSPMEMVLPCGILIGLGVICFAIGVKRLKWE